MKGIADTGFLVAFGNRDDQHHEWAVAVAEQITEPLLTCEAVLAETAFHLQDTSLVLAMVRDGLVEVAFDCRDHWSQLEALAERYADRNPDLADLCLIRLSELHPRHTVVTVDREDFTVYRRNKREVIPTLFPAGK
ncbi:MAG: PIN domain-containing protein [Gammaproteobacteria bacterium]|nr:PIN domain-containing protein [Gammaproteobacteria bacterium]